MRRESITPQTSLVQRIEITDAFAHRSGIPKASFYCMGCRASVPINVRVYVGSGLNFSSKYAPDYIMSRYTELIGNELQEVCVVFRGFNDCIHSKSNILSLDPPGATGDESKFICKIGWRNSQCDTVAHLCSTCFGSLVGDVQLELMSKFKTKRVDLNTHVVSSVWVNADTDSILSGFKGYVYNSIFFAKL